MMTNNSDEPEQKKLLSVQQLTADTSCLLKYRAAPAASNKPFFRHLKSNLEIKLLNEIVCSALLGHDPPV